MTSRTRKAQKGVTFNMMVVGKLFKQNRTKLI